MLTAAPRFCSKPWWNDISPKASRGLARAVALFRPGPVAGRTIRTSCRTWRTWASSPAPTPRPDAYHAARYRNFPSTPSHDQAAGTGRVEGDRRQSASRNNPQAPDQLGLAAAVGSCRILRLVASPRRKSAAFRPSSFCSFRRSASCSSSPPRMATCRRILFTEKTYRRAAPWAETSSIRLWPASAFDQIAAVQEELKQLHQDMTSLMTAALDAGRSGHDEEHGELRHFGREKPARLDRSCSNMARLRELFDLFDKKTLFVANPRHEHGARKACRFSSAENPALRCSTSAAWSPPPTPWTDSGRHRRRDRPDAHGYERVIPIVDITAKLLSSALSGN